MQGALRARRRRILLAVAGGVSASLLAWWVMPPLAFPIAGIAALVLFFSSITGASSVPADQMTGAEGEYRVLQELSKLPDDHVLFNQVYVPDARLPNGRRELDFVVVGPSGVHVIEVKNARGLIYVRPDQRQWPLAHKAGCGGRPGWNAIDNPIGQVRAQVDALDRWLLQHGRVAPIQPLICFARPEVALQDRDQADVPILTTGELVDHIRQCPDQAPGAVGRGVVELLSRHLPQPAPATA
ncbi:MAG: NERD domain-containing protein [Wenzhouxiangella sp.]|nr:MAG: NERD domain-containing protein [Wenzhouxiangella sp.]